jgi:hypothetical protein
MIRTIVNDLRDIPKKRISLVLRRMGEIKVILSASVALLVFFGFRKALKIDFGPVDDHEILKFLGSDREIKFYQLPGVLWQETEVGHWGQTSRYRPSYYFLRILETTVFETHAKLWFASRLAMLCVTALALSATVVEVTATRSRSVKFSIGISTVFVILSIKSFPEIIFRLGIAETYLVLAFAVFLFSFTKLIQNSASRFFWNLILLSLVVAIGSKENGVALVIPFLYLLVVQLKTYPQVRKARIFQGFTAVVFACLVIVNSLKNIAEVGTDVYGSQRGLRASLSLLQQFSENSSTRISSLVLILIMSLTVINYSVARRFKSTTKAALFMSILLYLLLATEFVFYQGSFGELRYQLITELSSNLLVFILIAVVLSTFSLVMPHREVVLGLVVILGFFLSHQIGENYSQSIKTNGAIADSLVLQTEEYQTKLKAIEEALIQKSYRGIVIQLNNVWDYEPAYAISQYVAFLGNGLPVSLKVDIAQVALGLETTLLNQLLEYQSQGSIEWKVLPQSQVMQVDNLCIVFNGAPADSQICKASLPG